MRWALVGCGRMGRAHLAAMRHHPEVELVAVVDPALSSPPHDAGALREYDEVLRDPGVDAVLLATPTPLHARQVRQALTAGKHVLCEKPLTLDPTTDAELARLADRLGLRLHVGYWRRHAEGYVRLRRLLREQAIGPLRAIHCAQWDAVAPPADFCDPAVSGGIEIDCGVHELDLVRWLTGLEPQVLAAIAPPPPADLEAVGDAAIVRALGHTADGTALSIDLVRCAGGEDGIRTEVIGTTGSIVLEFTSTGTLELRGPAGTERWSLVEDVIGSALTEQLSALMRATSDAGEDEASATPVDARSALVAAHSMRERRLQADV